MSAACSRRGASRRSRRPAAATGRSELALLGGDTTIFDDGDEAFAYPAAQPVGRSYRGPFQIGDGIFNRNWVAAPATPQGSDGLGPTYNAMSCSALPRQQRPRRAAPEGRRAVPRALAARQRAGADEHGGPMPDPSYGDQLNPYGDPRRARRRHAEVTYTEVPGQYGDGKPYSLRAPTYSIDALGVRAARRRRE